MALMRQVKTNAHDEELQKKRDEFIRGGGLVSSDVKKKSKPKWTKMLLRIKEETIEKIEDEISHDDLATRTSWILQAIEEKLNRTEKHVKAN